MVDNQNTKVKFTDKNLDVMAIQENSLKSILDRIRNETIRREEDVKTNEPVECVKIETLSPTHSMIPETFDFHKRAMPNAFVRSALFGIMKYNNKKRDEVKNEKIFSTSQYEIFFTGELFDQNDLSVWDAIVYLSKNNMCARELHTSLYEICKYIGINNDTRNRDAITERLKRLSLSKLEINYDIGHYYGSLIMDYGFHKEKGVLVELNNKILNLFVTKDFTIFDKKIGDELGKNQLAKWLFHFYYSHKKPIPFKIDFLRKCCGSKATTKEYKRLLKISMTLIKKSYEKYDQKFDFIIKDDELLVSKTFISPNLIQPT